MLLTEHLVGKSETKRELKLERDLSTSFKVALVPPTRNS
jgi:hypothetical protein